MSSLAQAKHRIVCRSPVLPNIPLFAVRAFPHNVQNCEMWMADQEKFLQNFRFFTLVCRSQTLILTEQCPGRHWSDSFSLPEHTLLQSLPIYQGKIQANVVHLNPKQMIKLLEGVRLSAASLLPHCPFSFSHCPLSAFAGKRCPDKCVFLNPRISHFSCLQSTATALKW